MASVGQYYADHIFPSTWGWTTKWYAGMPFPQFYPPLFFFVMAIIYKILPFFSYITLFKIIVTILQLAIPGLLVFFVANRIKDKWSLWLTGIFSVFLLCSYFPIMGNSGVNIGATLNTGMVTQLLSFIMLILWLHFFLKIEHDVKSRYFAGFFLFLTFLSNAHNDIVVLIIFTTIYLLSVFYSIKETAHLRQKVILLGRNFSIYFLTGLLPLAATAFWSTPLYYTYTYFTSVSPYELPTFWQFMTIMGLFPFLAIITFLVSLQVKKKTVTQLSLVIIVGICFMYIPTLLGETGLPIHVNRWFAVISFLFPVVTGLVYEDVIKILKIQKYRIIVFIVTVVVVFMGLGTYSFVKVGGYSLTFKQDNFQSIIDYFTEHKDLGMFMVETHLIKDGPTSFVYSDVLSQIGEGAAVVNLRESSINSVYMTPVRNSLSNEHELFGFKSYLAQDTTFTDQNISANLDRAEQMGIQSFLIRSKKIKDIIVTDPRIILDKNFGSWTLYSLRNVVPRANIVPNAPLLFYGSLTFKDRNITDYDWSRIQEEVLFNNDKNITFIYPTDRYLDTSPELTSASTTFVSTYIYHDFDTAFERLVAYSKQNNLIVVADRNPLSGKLYSLYMMSSTTNKYHITFIDHLQPTVLNPNPLRDQMAELFNKIKLINPPVSQSQISVSGTVLDDNKIVVQLNGTSTTPVPVLIKSSYFPAWRRTDGVPVYLATPGYMLTYATSTFEIDFTTPGYVYVGYGISILAVVISGVTYYFCIFRKRRLNVS